MAEEPNDGGSSANARRGFDSAEGGFLSNGLMALLVFMLGVAIGFPAATLGVGLLADNAVPVLGGMMAALIALLAVAAIVLVYRRRIWEALFRRGAVEATRLAGPLGDVARFVAEHRVPEAISSARDFAEIAVARYAWVVTRRWMLATVTALVVAIAALAGAALLFQQNQLLRDQSALLAEQNQRISDQTTLMQAQIQLGEAQRSTAIVPEILAIGEALGEETAALAADGRRGATFDAAELSAALRARIIAAANAARPYRHLLSANGDLNDIELIIMALARRTDLPGALAQYERWQETQPLARPLAELGTPTDELTDREVSPERGQIISLLYNAGIRTTVALTYAGADFSFAELRQPMMAGMSFRHAMLRFADFSGVYLDAVDFRAGLLDHARFRGSNLAGVTFDSIPGAELEAPYTPLPATPFWYTELNGADFAGAAIIGSSFRSVRGVAANFDGTLIVGADFTGAELGAATFRNAVLYDCDFAGAALASVDFDGAIVFDADFVTNLGTAALDRTFAADRFTIEPLAPEAVIDHPQFRNLDPTLLAAIDGGAIAAYRVVRTGEFEDDPARGAVVFEP
jgi:uncharacterized protein YjbI with pentapeptide repeats